MGKRFLPLSDVPKVFWGFHDTFDLCNPTVAFSINGWLLYISPDWALYSCRLVPGFYSYLEFLICILGWNIEKYTWYWFFFFHICSGVHWICKGWKPLAWFYQQQRSKLFCLNCHILNASVLTEILLKTSRYQDGSQFISTWAMGLTVLESYGKGALHCWCARQKHGHCRAIFQVSKLQDLHISSWSRLSFNLSYLPSL